MSKDSRRTGKFRVTGKWDRGGLGGQMEIAQLLGSDFYREQAVAREQTGLNFDDKRF